MLERTSLPALGSWLRTFPGDCEEDGSRVTVPLARPALEIAAWAPRKGSRRVTSGTVTSAGPLDTSTVTVLPWRSTRAGRRFGADHDPGGDGRAGGVVDLGDEAGAMQAVAGFGGVQPVDVGQGDVGRAAGDDDLDGRALARGAARGRGLA